MRQASKNANFVALQSFNTSHLSSTQKHAVTYRGKSLLILAGPGTGKTRVIISRILHEVYEHGIGAEKVLAVTFSRKATQEMEDRLAESAVDLVEKVHIKTLHSLGLEIVEKHGFRLGLGKKPQLISEAQAELFLRKIVDSLPLLPLLKTSSIEPILEDLMTFFSQCKDSGLWPEDIMRYAHTLPEGTSDETEIKREWAALGDIYNAFQSKCFEEGFLDFGDCLLLAHRLLEEFAIVRNEIQEAYESILVDEFQDTNWTQIQFLKFIVGQNCKIAVVGDDDQSIYRFRGASYSAFTFFMDAFPETEVLELTDTYRLPASIAEAATVLIGANGERRFRPNKTISSKSNQHGTVTWLRTQNEGQEGLEVAKLIQKKLADGNNPRDIAVLCRSHSHAELIRDQLQSLSLPFRQHSSRDLLASDAVQDCLALLRLLTDPTETVSFYRLLDSFFVDISASEIFAFCRAASQKKDLFETLASSSEKLTSWKTILEELTKEALSAPPSDLLLSAFEKTKGLKNLATRDPSELKNIGLFFSELVHWEKIQPQQELRALAPLLDRLDTLNTSEDSSAPSHTLNAVSIMSVHSSKGLEFDHVIVPSLVSRRFPSTLKKPVWILPQELSRESSFNSVAHQDEERRLLYVAMTRAKKTLTLCSFEKKGTRPSIFLTQDLKSLIESQSIFTDSYMDEPYSEVPLTHRLPFSRSKNQATDIPMQQETRALSLSYTQLEKYEACPLSYQFRYDYQIPVRIPVQMSVGSAIHKALEVFFTKRKDGNILSKELLLAEFEKAFAEEAQKALGLNETHKRLGLEKLSKYFDYCDGKFGMPFAIEQDFVLPLGPHKIRGKIDRVDKTDGGFRIIDYKTGRSRSNDKTEDQKFAKESLQFSIYALAAKEVFRWPLQELIFDYVYDCKTLSTTRNDDELEATKNKILDIATQIQKKNFSAKPGFQCQWCEYRDLCPSAV